MQLGYSTFKRIDICLSGHHKSESIYFSYPVTDLQHHFSQNSAPKGISKVSVLQLLN